MVESIQVECDLVKFSYIIHDGLYFQSLTARSSSQLGQAGPIRQGAKRVLYLCNRCRLAVGVNPCEAILILILSCFRPGHAKRRREPPNGFAACALLGVSLLVELPSE